MICRQLKKQVHYKTYKPFKGGAMMKQTRTKFWWITHIAAWAMLIVTILGAILGSVAAFG
jgi:hypothetical protein